MDTRIGLCFDHVDPTGFVYYKPVAPDASKGSSMRLTQTLVREYFHEMRLEGSRLTLVVGHEQKPPPEARIQLRFDHVNPRGCVYYKPADPDVRKGSLHLTPTLVRQHFRGLRPESFWLALVMATTEFKISEEPLAERVLRQVRSGTVDEARLLPSAEKRARDAGKKLDRLAARQGWYTFMAGQAYAVATGKPPAKRNAEIMAVEQVLRWRSEVSRFAPDRLAEFDELIADALNNPAPVQKAEQ